MRGAAKSLKLLKAPKKNAEEKPGEVIKEEIPEETVQRMKMLKELLPLMIKQLQRTKVSVPKTDPGKVVVVENLTQLLKCLSLDHTLHPSWINTDRTKQKVAENPSVVGEEMVTYENVREKYVVLFAFTPPWTECIAEGYIKEGEDRVRPPQPPIAHPSSIKAPANYPKEVEKKAKAKAKRDKKVDKTVTALEYLLVNSCIQKHPTMFKFQIKLKEGLIKP
jgi:hypothetical protein